MDKDTLKDFQRADVLRKFHKDGVKCGRFTQEEVDRQMENMPEGWEKRVDDAIERAQEDR